MDSQCIICLKVKPQLSREHVFPKTIGGEWVIESVCKECNHLMGKSIERPFNRHKGIALFRKLLNISADGRSIPNPFAGRHRVEGTDEEVELTFRNGQITSKAMPTFLEPKMNDQGVLEGKIVISSDMANNGTDWAEVYMKKMKLKDGFAVAYQNIEESPRRDLVFTMVESNDSLLPEFAKIAYETAATLIPAYLDDPAADLFRKFLRKGKLPSPLGAMIGFRVVPTELFQEELSVESKFPEQIHVAKLIQKKGKGLFCLVKIFHLFHLMKLSDCDNYLMDSSVLVVNDSIEQKKAMQLRVVVNQTLIKIILNVTAISQLQAGNEFRFQIPESDAIPLYDENGVPLLDDIKEIDKIPNVATTFRIELPNRLTYKTIWIPRLFVKDLNSGHHFQVGEITFDCLATYLNPNPEVVSSHLDSQQ